MTYPNILIIAGLDPSGGAGLLADTRVAERCGARAVGVVTALTEQDTGGVRSVHVPAVEVIEAQLRAVLADVEVAAVKIGMLGSEAVAEVVADALDATGAPVVWDPVLLPTRGRVPLYQGAPARAVQLLGRHVTVCTPNIPEAEVLAGLDIDSVEAMAGAGATLRAAGLDAVLVKGGHLPEGAGTASTDVLVEERGTTILEGPHAPVAEPVHGTGCALATALAASLAEGEPLESAARFAKGFVAGCLGALVRPGRGLAAII